MLMTFPWSWSIKACMRSWFFLSSSHAKTSSLMVRSDLRRFLKTSPLRRLSASNSDSNSLMRVSILIIAFLPPFRALTFQKFFYPSPSLWQYPVHNEVHQQDEQHQPLPWQPCLLKAWLHLTSHQDLLPAG